MAPPRRPHLSAVWRGLFCALFCLSAVVAQAASRNAAAPNRLAASHDPYLLEHAHDPVDWYPWGQQALDKARRENKPIYLSIGYSACYWCHVAQRELYRNPQIAALMNRWFVNVV